MNKYRRIKYEDRCQIYALSKRGSSQESIAEVLGVSQSAVSREMQRNRGQRGYRFKQAEAKSQARQAIRSKARKLAVWLLRAHRPRRRTADKRNELASMPMPKPMSCPSRAIARRGHLLLPFPSFEEA